MAGCFLSILYRRFLFLLLGLYLFLAICGCLKIEKLGKYDYGSRKHSCYERKEAIFSENFHGATKVGKYAKNESPGWKNYPAILALMANVRKSSALLKLLLLGITMSARCFKGLIRVSYTGMT